MAKFIGDMKPYLMNKTYCTNVQVQFESTDHGKAGLA